MIPAIACLLLFQLLGETLALGLGLTVPGPVLGMGLLLVAFWASPALRSIVTPTAKGLLSHLSLLFVPAGVGVIAHASVLAQSGPALIIALVGSTLLAMAVAALTFAGVARLMSLPPAEDPE